MNAGSLAFPAPVGGEPLLPASPKTGGAEKSDAFSTLLGSCMKAAEGCKQATPSPEGEAAAVSEPCEGKSSSEQGDADGLKGFFLALLFAQGGEGLLQDEECEEPSPSCGDKETPAEGVPASTVAVLEATPGSAGKGLPEAEGPTFPEEVAGKDLPEAEGPTFPEEVAGKGLPDRGGPFVPEEAADKGFPDTGEPAAREKLPQMSPSAPDVPLEDEAVPGAADNGRGVEGTGADRVVPVVTPVGEDAGSELLGLASETVQEKTRAETLGVPLSGGEAPAVGFRPQMPGRREPVAVSGVPQEEAEGDEAVAVQGHFEGDRASRRFSEEERNRSHAVASFESDGGAEKQPETVPPASELAGETAEPDLPRGRPLFSGTERTPLSPVSAEPERLFSAVPLKEAPERQGTADLVLSQAGRVESPVAASPAEELPRRLLSALPLNEGLAGAVQTTLSLARNRARVVVEPPALGRVEIYLRQGPQGIETTFRVDNEGLRQLVQTHLDQLRTALQQTGIVLQELSVDIRDGGEGSPWAEAEKRLRALLPEDDDEPLEFSIDLEQGLLSWMA